MSSTENKMTKPKEYQKMINALDIENFELKTSNALEARITLVNLQRLEEELHEIRRNVSGNMRAISLKYLESRQQKSSFLGLKSKTSSRRKSLDTKKVKEQGPYKKVLYIIDDYLNQIEEIKEYIDNLNLE